MSSTGAIGVLQLGTLFGGAAAEAAPTALGALSSLLASQGDTYTGVASQLTSADSVQVSLGLESLRGVLLSGNARLLTDLAAIIQPEEALSDETVIRAAVDMNERRWGRSIGRTFFFPAQAGLATSVYREETVDRILTALGELHELRIVSGLAAFIGGRGEIDRAVKLYQWALLAAEHRNDRTAWIQDAAALGDLYRRSGYAIAGDLIESRAALLVPETSLRSIETIIAEWEAIGRSFETLLNQFINNEISPAVFLQMASSLRSEIKGLRQGLRDDPRFRIITRTYLHASTLGETRKQVELLSRKYMAQGIELVDESVEIPSGETYLLLREMELRTARRNASLSFWLASVAPLPKEDPVRRFHRVHTAVMEREHIVLEVLRGIEESLSFIRSGTQFRDTISRILREASSWEDKLKATLESTERDPHDVMKSAVVGQCLLDAVHIALTEKSQKGKGGQTRALLKTVAARRTKVLPFFRAALAQLRKAEWHEGSGIGAIEPLLEGRLAEADDLFLRASLKLERGGRRDAVQDLRQALAALEQPHAEQRPQVTISDVLTLLARTLSEDGFTDEALRLARECADRHPEDLRLAFAYAEVLERADRSLEAIQIYYRRVINGQEDCPLAALARYNVAKIYLQFHMGDQAITEIRRIIRTYPEAADVFFHLGEALEHESPLPFDELFSVYGKGLECVQEMIARAGDGRPLDEFLRQSARRATQTFAQINARIRRLEICAIMVGSGKISHRRVVEQADALIESLMPEMRENLEGEVEKSRIPRYLLETAEASNHAEGVVLSGIKSHFFGKAAAALRELIARHDTEIVDPALEDAITAWQEMSRDPQMWVLDPQQLREFADLVDLIGSHRPERIDITILQSELAQVLGEGEKAESLSRRARDVAPQSLYLRDHLVRFLNPVFR